MRDLAGLMKQAQELQKKMADSQASIERLSVEGVSGGGLVRVTMKGTGEVTTLSIDPSLINKDEAEVLEDLLVTALNDARNKAEAAKTSQMKEMTAGLQLPPGMKLPF